MTNIGQLPKDVYLLLTDYSSDRDIINMLSVNKTYNNTIFFSRILNKRYPALIRLKKEKESWKNFYLRMIYYLSILQDEYDIPYINVPSFDPIIIYKGAKIGLPKDYLIPKYIGETGDEKIISDYIDKNKNLSLLNFFDLLNGIAKSGNLELFKKYENYGIFNDLLLIRNSMLSKNPEIIKYVFDKVTALPDTLKKDVLEEQMAAAILLNDLILFRHYEEQVKPLITHKELKIVYGSLLEEILQGNSILIARYFIRYGRLKQDTIYDYLLEFVKTAHTDKDLDIIKYFFTKLEEPYRNFLNEFRDLLHKTDIDKDVVSYFENFK